MSSDEYDQSDSEVEDDLAAVWKDEAESDVRMSREGKNVGKSLRNLAELDDEGQVIKKARVFDEAGQLPLGARGKVKIPNFSEEDDEDEDGVGFHDGEDDDSVNGDTGPVVLKSTTTAKPSHVRNQRKNEAEIVGLRIRLQGLVNLMSKLPGTQKITNSSPLRDIVHSLLNVRNLMVKNGSFEVSVSAAPDVDEEGTIDDLWVLLGATEDRMWSQHRKVIEAWERRAHLATSKGKALRAVNKSAFEQTEAALARRAETGNLGSDFLKEDSDFYQQLLRDFVQARSAESNPAIKDRARLKRKQYLERQANKEPRINYDVHEKMVNFLTPVTIPAPPVDIDQLIKSLFKS